MALRRLVLVLAVITATCSRVPVRGDIAAAIDAQIAAGQSEINLSEIADVDWDEVCFLGPFMRPADISNLLGFKWHGKRSRSNGSVVFVKVAQPRADSQATGVFHLPTPIEDRTGYLFDARACLPRNRAVFAVQRMPNRPVSLIPKSRT